MRDLISDPTWQEKDLGEPLPESDHAVSVAMPLWEHVVGYEEGDPEVLNQLACGYPRFVVHPIVQRLFDAATAEFAEDGEKAAVLPSSAAAERFACYVRREHEARVESWKDGLHAVVFPEAAEEVARNCWRFCGEVVSSRRAQTTLNGDAHDVGNANSALRKKLASLAGQNEDDVFLFPSGIAAIYAAQRLATRLHPGRKTVQVEFPYVDVLKVQEQFGAGEVFLPNCEAGGVPGVRQLLESGEAPSGVFCEIPSNPQLRTADLAGLRALLEPEGIPLVADDTIATIRNVDCFAHADIVTTSLTKFISGAGDVLGGSLILNRNSPLYAELSKLLREDHVDDLFPQDASALVRNAADFGERVSKINKTTEALTDFLSNHSAVSQVWYPKTATPDFYNAIRRDGGGYGGIFSMLLHDPTNTAPKFYDQLRVCKGPSLGTNFTLACPYMLLAHYPELDWCEDLGIDRWLVRVSVGLEDSDDLIQRFEEALDS